VGWSVKIVTCNATRGQTTSPGQKLVAFQITRRFVGQARRLLFFLVGAASVSLSLQLQSYAQNAPEQVTPDTKTYAITDPIADKGGQVAVNVKAFGATGDGMTNDTAAFNAALRSLTASGGGVCLVPKGTYIISASGLTVPYTPAVSSDTHLLGEGRGVSILKVNGMPRTHLLQCDGDYWSVENLTFDMGNYTPSVGLTAIACKGNHWRVSNCTIVKSGRWGIAAFGGNNWSIERNYISRTVPGARPATGAILVTASAGVWSSHGRVINNVCEGAGITFSGSDGIIARNQVDRSGFGSGIFVQGLPSTHSLTITGNICSGGSSGFDAAQEGRWWSVNGFEIWAPDSVIYNNIAHDNDGGGFAIGGQNSIVVGNKAYNNGRGRAGYAGFNARVNPARGATASHSIFIGNFAYAQDYGYAEQPGGLTDIKHFENDYNRNRIGPAKYSSAGDQPAAQGSRTIQMRISPEMKNKLKALAEDADMPDIARRGVRECLSR